MSGTVLFPYRDLDEIGPYEAALRAAGIDSEIVSVDTPMSLDGFQGLFLMGGCDVNPRLYGEAPHPETEEPDEERDEVESALIGAALERDVSMLAVCRGIQILNVHLGGSLVQHLGLPRHRMKIADRGEPVHEVEIAPGTLLSRIAGQPCWNVNSRHHQAIAALGCGLAISARDPLDSTIEAVEMPDRRYVLGVQWHPEDQAPRDAGQAALFRSFANALG